jgi:hypothetical protein
MLGDQVLPGPKTRGCPRRSLGPYFDRFSMTCGKLATSSSHSAYLGGRPRRGLSMVMLQWGIWHQPRFWPGKSPTPSPPETEIHLSVPRTLGTRLILCPGVSAEQGKRSWRPETADIPFTWVGSRVQFLSHPPSSCDRHIAPVRSIATAAGGAGPFAPGVAGPRHRNTVTPRDS